VGTKVWACLDERGRSGQLAGSAGRPRRRRWRRRVRRAVRVRVDAQQDLGPQVRAQAALAPCARAGTGRPVPLSAPATARARRGRSCAAGRRAALPGNRARRSRGHIFLASFAGRRRDASPTLNQGARAGQGLKTPKTNMANRGHGPRPSPSARPSESAASWTRSRGRSGAARARGVVQLSHVMIYYCSNMTKSPHDLHCYACENPATSWEHAPAKGFYPRRRQVYRPSPAVDFRRNLIEVPSCDDHNADKSQDDNFSQVVIGVIALCVGQGALPHPIIRDWLTRARQHPRIRRALVDDAKLVRTPRGPMYSIQPEVHTLARILELTARALYYHEHKWAKRWPGTCNIVSPHFMNGDLYPSDGTLIGWQAVKQFNVLYRGKVQGFELRGPHPTVFAYQVHENEVGLAMRMTFYGSFHAVAFGGAPPTV
jgi:hypothetical protein